MALVTSPSGVKAIQKHEGLVLETYVDAVGDDAKEIRMWSETFFGPRKLARCLGKKYYFDGNPCINGHDGIRYTSKATCFHCAKERAVAWKKANPSKVKEGSKMYSVKNKDKISAVGKEWVKNNPDKVAAKAKRYLSTEKGRSLMYEKNKMRRRGTRNATPKWLTKEERDVARQLYIIRRRVLQCTGLQFHVDHAVPLKGKTVCGLHVPWNLQLLPAVTNMQKNNKLWEESEEQSLSC